jgi:regulator of nonsense transcripts 2
LLEQDKRNHEAYIKSGEIFEDRQQAYEKMTKAVERLTAGVQSLSELLGLPMPALPTAASLAKSGLQIVEGQSSFTVREDGAVPGGIWDDDEERRFYEEILDLKQVVPASLLGLKEEKGSADGESGGSAERTAEADAKRKQDEEDIRRQLEQMEHAPDAGSQAVPMERAASDATAASPAVVSDPLPEEDEGPAPTDGAEDDGMQSGPAARLNVLFAALPEAVNREMIDKLAVEFASLNSKAARRRLVRFIGAVPKNRTDLLPHYARFVATLDPYMPDVGAGVLEILEEELRYLQRKRHVRELDSVRLKNVRFYGELAKFKVAKPYAILHVLKVYLDDFKFNIENIANLLENCGRFLLRYEGTAKTAKDMVGGLQHLWQIAKCQVELMRRKQSNSHLDQRHNVMLENAFYMCNPPERVVREVVQLSPMQSFIQHLLHDVLAKRTLDKVTKLLRKLHWEDQEVYDYLISSFTEVWEVRYSNIPFLAAMVYDLQKYHPEFSVIVVDQVMEDIRTGMEVSPRSSNTLIVRRISSNTTRDVLPLSDILANCTCTGSSTRPSSLTFFGH